MVAKFWSENEIQTHIKFVEDFDLSTFRRLQVDGLVKLVNEKKDAMYSPLEFESTAKSKARYLEKLKKYYDSPSVETILFVSKSLEIQELVKKVERDNFNLDSKKIYFAHLDDLLVNSEKLTFRNQESLKLEIR